MRRFIAAAVTAAAVAVPVAAVGGSAEAATRHHMTVVGPNASSAYPKWYFQGEGNASGVYLVVKAGAYTTVKDRLKPVQGVVLCLQHKLKKGSAKQPWTAVKGVKCKKTDKNGNVTLKLKYPPDRDWYYRVHHAKSAHYVTADSKKIYPDFKG
ncbi:hypothetical protein GCM10023196_058700 [Actinoallomurus vinaceus]|uniref:Uncharacterized protein n=1 Tax=Actinoallomurus vinaceus TaxID=1080074 RepID=A0ABP8UI21_9ACTN